MKGGAKGRMLKRHKVSATPKMMMKKSKTAAKGK